MFLLARAEAPEIMRQENRASSQGIGNSSYCLS